MSISVIIPTYNNGKTLQRCIQSVLNQVEVDFEIIIVDDGSSDNTKNIVESFSSDLIKYYYKENGGVSSARNLGIINAEYNKLFFLDSDDILYDKYSLSKLNEANHKFLTVSRYINLSDSYNIKRNGEQEVLLNTFDSFTFLINDNLLNSCCFKIFNKELIINNRLFFNEEISMGEDLEFNIRYMKEIDSFIYLNRYTYIYDDKSSTSSSNNYHYNMGDKYIKIYELLLSYIKDVYECQPNSKFYNYLLNTTLFTHLAIEINNSNKSFAELIREIKLILDLKVYKNIIHNVNVDELGFKDRLKYYLVKRKKIITLILLYKLKSLKG